MNTSKCSDEDDVDDEEDEEIDPSSPFHPKVRGHFHISATLFESLDDFKLNPNEISKS